MTLPSAKAAGFSIHPTSASCKRIGESNSLYALYRFKAGFVGCLDLPVKRVHAELWRRMEAGYTYRLHQRLEDGIYY